ncbi:hypothetical protein [Rhizobium straminoryzae]|uniref:Uncharacterized protein n=1 Tax=Rhizobium straminoryzae TaxID=1387186 RepID=A0A549T0T6_9HYPH|nr:hypothetical protein [Rhizobium straminoryzae]TRL35497.1 hypothetical protein FNA46_20055 [Rhizobium straminoryzae]
MSLVRQLIQIALVEAWRGRTLAGEFVYDSKIDPLAGFLAGQPAPILIASVEEAEQAEDGQATRGVMGRPASLTIMVQTGVATGREIRDENGVIVLGAIGESDASYEAMLNLLDFQWRCALHDPDNSWAVLFRSLVTSIGTIKDVRATDPETGSKHAARFTQFKAEVLPDPMPGDTLPDAIEAGLTALEADGDPGFALIAASWRLMLEGSPDRPDWRILQSGLFTTDAGMAALGQIPAAIDTPADVELSMPGAKPVVISHDP